MSKKIKIISDSTSDLSPELQKQYDIEIVPLIVTLGSQSFTDGVNVFPDDLYEYYGRTKKLPKTAAPTPEEYARHFRQWTDAGYAVICFTISSDFSASYANAKIAAAGLPDVYVVDSRNLSTGIGLQVLHAAELAAQGTDAAAVFEEIQEMRGKVRASFIIDTLEFLWKGGRCSGVAALGANLLRLKPGIDVTDGKMDVGKKYRGDLRRCLQSYVEFKLKDRGDLDLRRIFITHSGMTDPSNIELVRKEILKYQPFQEILVTRAGSTISTHCGPNTLGILFVAK
ncbi:MAG: DegV family protein [Firmicutes bacterium]|nr:DegV family protein [Bacillota bacterium]